MKMSKSDNEYYRDI